MYIRDFGVDIGPFYALVARKDWGWLHMYDER
jgi:hypothetical protein